VVAVSVLALVASPFALVACESAPRSIPSRGATVASVAAAEAKSSGAPPQQEALLEDRAIDWDANAVMRVLGRMAASVTESEYTHGFRVNEKRGIYAFDCSGMTHWVLRRAAPRAAAASAFGLSGRPLARDYQRRIARVAPGSTRHGWSRVQRVDEARPGDVIAWIKPKIIDSPNTGHVAFVLLPPVRVTGYENAYLVRIADSTSLLHDDDTRGGGSGFGFGTILLVTNESGAPTAYGWVGLRWRAFETEIAIGRPRA